MTCPEDAGAVMGSGGVVVCSGPDDRQHLYLSRWQKKIEKTCLVCISSLSSHLIIPSLPTSLFPPLCRCHSAQVGTAHMLSSSPVACGVWCMLHWSVNRLTSCLASRYRHLFLTASVYLLWFSEYQPIRDFWRHVHPSWHNLSIGE